MNKITLEDSRDFLEWREASGRSIEIYDIQVGSERRKGRGRELISALMDHIHDLFDTGPHLVFAITRENNLIARDFYNALGFRTIGLLEGFHREDRTHTGEWIEGHKGNAIMYGLDL